MCYKITPKFMFESQPLCNKALQLPMKLLRHCDAQYQKGGN
jgi:hypothetical protein